MSVYGKNTLHRGFSLINPDKYMDKVPLPKCKSAWEEKIFVAMDRNPYIKKWGYEPFDIYYMSPKFKRMSIYKPDIYCECDDGKGGINRVLIEIKPQKFSVMPKQPSPLKANATPAQQRRYQKKMGRYYAQMEEVMVNQAKWAAAKQWCIENRMNWVVLTEENVNGLFDSNVHI